MSVAAGQQQPPNGGRGKHGSLVVFFRAARALARLARSYLAVYLRRVYPLLFAPLLPLPLLSVSAPFCPPSAATAWRGDIGCGAVRCGAEKGAKKGEDGGLGRRRLIAPRHEMLLDTPWSMVHVPSLSLLHVMMQRHRETWYLMGTLRQRRPFGGVGILARGGAVGIVPSSESDDLKGRESRSICAT